MFVSGQETLLNVREASQMSGSSQEALSDVLEWSGGSLGKSGRGWEAHTDVREWTGDPGNVREWWEALTNAREWLGGPHKCSGVVGRPFRLSGSGR